MTTMFYEPIQLLLYLPDLRRLLVLPNALREAGRELDMDVCRIQPLLIQEQALDEQLL
jgi:hypothetical protein